MTKRIDEDLLNTYREKRCCERCKYVSPGGQALEPHHIKPRGHGAGSRLDTNLNLVALCQRCHQKMQLGGRKAQIECWEIVARREGLESWEVCEAATWKLLRTPK